MDRRQLFCFTHAGGKADFFDIIEEGLSDTELVKLEYPGHGTRIKEPLCSDIYELADDMFCMLQKRRNGAGYGLFGYSMGSIVLTEVLKRILQSNTEPPECVFLAAHALYSKREMKGFESDEFDEKVKERTIAFGGVPEKLINNNSFWRLYLPLFRADYDMIDKYRFDKMTLKAETIPAAIFYSEEDIPFSEMLKWKNVFSGKCDFYEFKGSHFFINDHYGKMAEIIKRMMKADSGAKI